MIDGVRDGLARPENIEAAWGFEIAQASYRSHGRERRVMIAVMTPPGCCRLERTWKEAMAQDASRARGVVA